MAYPPYAPAASQPRPVSGLSVAGLVVGVVGLLTCWVPFAGAVLPAVAVVLGAVGAGRSRRDGSAPGLGIAATVLGGIGVVGAVTVTTLFLLLWPRISACDGPGQTSDQVARCLREQFGIPEPADQSDVHLLAVPRER